LYLEIDTGAGTNDSIDIGYEDTVHQEVTVKTGAGSDVVTLEQNNGDDGAEAIVDFVYADELGLGNELDVYSSGTVHLANAPDTSPHTVYVDQVNVYGSWFSQRGGVIVEDEATIDDLHVHDHGTVTIDAADPVTISTFEVDGSDGQASMESETTIGTMEVEGTATFTADSTVDNFQDTATGDPPVRHGTVNVDAGAFVDVLDQSVVHNLNVVGTDAKVRFQYTGDFGSATTVSSLTVTDGGLVTLLPRGDSPASDLGKARVLVVGTLDLQDGSMSATGVLDVTDTDLIVTSTSYSTIKTWIKSGYNASGTHWAGNGIISSVTVTSPNPTAVGYAVASNFSYSSFGGVSVNSSDVLVKYTYAGDANIDGQVDVSDNGILATNWQGTGKDWREADFNYDGTVDVTDLGFLAMNWQAGVGAPLSQEGNNHDPEQEFLDGIAGLGLSQGQIEDLLAILNTDSLPAL
jgi:hypothetical protein